LKVKDEGENISFIISDNGIGMDRETRNKAFSLFFSSKGSEGTGLGLFIANKIAQKHGGKIVLESELGEGSSFTIVFPKNPLPPEKTDTPEDS
jgi:signal transduction histidine kinase